MELFTCTSPTCCALQEIKELRTAPSPAAALWKICKDAQRYVGVGRMGPPVLANFYLFGGVEQFLNGPVVPFSREYCVQSGIRYDNHIREITLTNKMGYTRAFAKFIRANKLGRLATLPMKPNVLNHPDRMCKLYLWSPDHAAVQVWWDLHKHRTPETLV